MQDGRPFRGYNSLMSTTVGVRQLKNSLSRYLRLVRAGESVVVLDRGHPIAILSAIAPSTAHRTLAEHLASLAARGLVKLGTGRKRRRPSKLPRVDLSGAVDEDREERS